VFVYIKPEASVTFSYKIDECLNVR